PAAPTTLPPQTYDPQTRMAGARLRPFQLHLRPFHLKPTTLKPAWPCAATTFVALWPNTKIFSKALDDNAHTHKARKREALTRTHTNRKPFPLLALYGQRPAEAQLRFISTGSCSDPTKSLARLQTI
ncbi:MAG: hypothetical protein AAGJ35_13545, partial [Myxococcota bacterium]